MPPVQPSIRGSLLTGASALALSVSGTGSNAQTAQTPLQNVSVWVEGAAFWTGGGATNFPSLPGLGAPYTSFNPPHGPEWAIGADYQPQGQPWHYVFDFRYGQSGTTTVRTSGGSSSSSTSFVPAVTQPFFGFSSIVFGTTTNQTTSNSFATQYSERESHLVADLMIGRDLGLGANGPELLFGLRVADLHAAGQAQISTQSTTNSTTNTTFYAPTNAGTVGTTTASQSTSSSSSTFASWGSRFFGVGPRLAVTGAVPIMGAWSFDYSGGAAVLIGDQSFNVTVWNNGGPGLGASYGGTTAVFNMDGFTALSYRITPNFKLSAGIRADFYNAALKTYDVSTGGLQSLSRIYWGPFVRLTGSF
jgi:hypothetical protein